MSTKSRSPSPNGRDRSKTRSEPGVDRTRIGKDTNSNEASSIRCRIFIGNLATDKCSKEEVIDIFSKYGEVISASLHNNFGFVQYKEEDGADQAVLALHQTQLFGKKVDVNLAGLRRKQQKKDTFEPPPRPTDVVPLNMMNRPMKKSPPRGRSPARKRSRSRSPRSNTYSGSLSPRSRYEELYRRDDRSYRDELYDRSLYDKYKPDPFGRDDFRYERDMPPRDLPYRRPPYEMPPPPRRPSIDCEVVSLSKENSRYAEEVESRLRSIGLVCNIGYPPPEIPIADTIDRIVRTGTLYAIVLQISNVQHRSLTLNVLHGTRQEHRNMPLDDALSFVARNFDMYLKGIRDPGYRPIGPPAPRPSMPAQPPPSRDVSSLLRSDTDEKKLSNDELALLIEKLKREKEQRTGAKSAPSATQDDPERRKQLEAELKDLQGGSSNGTTSSYAAVSAPFPAAAPTVPAAGAATSYPAQQTPYYPGQNVQSAYPQNPYPHATYPTSYGQYGQAYGAGGMPTSSTQTQPSIQPLHPHSQTSQSMNSNYYPATPMGYTNPPTYR